MSNSAPEQCPLCLSHQVSPFSKDRQREYSLCSRCRLISVPARFHLSADAERRRYDCHQNSANDPDYRQFLQRLMKPLLTYIEPGQQGLDFGCGPGPTLSVMLQEQGYPMSVYDPFYANDVSVLQRQYDFITCSEAIEHFTQPEREWRRLLGLLVQGGRLAIMTRFHCSVPDFGNWYYKNDPTHIHFFSRATFDWLAQRDSLTVEYSGDSVAILEKSA